MSNRPIIAVTMGDPAGIGPEVILKALADPVIKKVSRPLILGDWGVLQRTRRRQRNAPPLICWQQGQPLLPLLNHRSAHVVCSLSTLTVRESRPGIASRAGGHGAFRYICVAAQLALSKVADAIATAPISKSSLIDAGYDYPGHTELFAELSRTTECRMMLIGAKLRVVPVTGHIRFTKVARDEEINVISPAVQSARKKGVPAYGPFPADSIFHLAARGEYDAVVCMYHDQGLIPLKLHHFFGGVALTLGPPFIRTSVDHGTAFDIAGTGKADASSMKQAIILAARLARRRMARRTQ